MGGESKCFKVVSTLTVLKKEKLRIPILQGKEKLERKEGKVERRKEGRRKKGRIEGNSCFLFLWVYLYSCTFFTPLRVNFSTVTLITDPWRH